MTDERLKELLLRISNLIIKPFYLLFLLFSPPEIQEISDHDNWMVKNDRLKELIPDVNHGMEHIDDRAEFSITKVENRTENLRKAVRLVEDLLEDRCLTCRVFNPQHKDCKSCQDIEDFRGDLSLILGIPYNEIGE